MRIAVKPVMFSTSIPHKKTIMKYSRWPVVMTLRFGCCDSFFADEESLATITNGMNANPRHVIKMLSIAFFGIVAAASGIAAEIERTRADEVIYDENGCTRPGSVSFGLGIVAIGALVVAWSITHCVFDPTPSWIERRAFGSHFKVFLTVLYVVSWLSYLAAASLYAVGTVMSHRMHSSVYSQCWTVKAGVFAGGAVLSYLTPMLHIFLIC